MTDGNNRQVQHRNAALDCTFQIGTWQVEPARNLLVDRHTAEQRRLEPRLMTLLCFLAANQGAVVPRDELVALLWPRVVVNENSLTRAVSELRKQLDAPATPARQAVQTIPKRGYRLSVPVSQNGEQSAAPPIAGLQSKTGRNSARFATRGRLLASGIAASLCLVLALGIGTRPSTPEINDVLASFSDEVVFSANDVTGSRFRLRATGSADITPGAYDQPVVSPDRQRFAFIERSLSASSIYLGKLNTSHEPVEVFSVPYRLSNLTWSPVGNALLFARQNELAPAVMYPAGDSDAELMRLDLDSGAVTRLVDNPAPAVKSSVPENNLTWFDAADSKLDRPQSREHSAHWQPDGQPTAKSATVTARPAVLMTPA